MVPSNSPRQSQAIPFCLRSRRNAENEQWADTNQGDILLQVENRLQKIIEENGFAHYEEAIEELNIIAKRILTLRSEYVENQEFLVKQAQKGQAKSELSDADYLIEQMSLFVLTGDISHIVPDGQFSSKEEKDLWRHFTFVDIIQVNGKSVFSNKMSNNRQHPFSVNKSNNKAQIGYAAVLDDGKGLIAIIPVEQNAVMLSKAFGSLYR